MQSPRAPVATVVAPPSVVDSEKNREYYYRRADRNDLTSLTLCFNAICVSIFLFSVQPHRWHLFPPSCLLHSVRPLDFVLDHVLPCPVHSCSLLLINVLSLLSSLYCLLFSFHFMSSLCFFCSSFVSSAPLCALLHCIFLVYPVHAYVIICWLCFAIFLSIPPWFILMIFFSAPSLYSTLRSSRHMVWY